mmetsp:Transcript_33905/g.76672  ORF Transcript_33905/g.76672 Transcript_33905/m.76672 type:complete len:523 (+) Transcript_33905:202-1770(+)
MTETMAPTHAPIAEPGQLDMTAKWKANEEARMAQLGGGSDPWDTKSELGMETKEEPLKPSAPPKPMPSIEEIQRKAREDAARQVANQRLEEERRIAELAKDRAAADREAEQRAALGDAGRRVDPDFLTALIKAGLGFQGILELLTEMEVTKAKDLQAVKYQDLVDSGLKPIQARKLKAIGMRSNHRAETPKPIRRPTVPERDVYQQYQRGSSTESAGNLRDSRNSLAFNEAPDSKKKPSMFQRFTASFAVGQAAQAQHFAADFEAQETGPTTEDYFEEGTQRYFKVERLVNNGEYTWGTLSPSLKKEMHEVRELWQRAADRGHPKAWHNLGYIYENGSGMPRDAKRAVTCWTQAAEYGDMDAQYNLGVMYAKGRGVERNEAKAVELLTLAAEKGDANAQLNLGIMYAKGRGVDKDEAKAFQLWARAAEQGHASAQYNLGAMYATGRGVEKDLERAVHLYHQAATQGVVQAQYSLGLMYQYGKSVEQNTGMAIELFTRAARQGHAKAQQHLDQLVLQGRDDYD